MPTNLVPLRRCGTVNPGWLNGSHPSVEDGEVDRTVCFRAYNNRCKDPTVIGVKNCGSYYIYKLHQLSRCAMRYCVVVQTEFEANPLLVIGGFINKPLNPCS